MGIHYILQSILDPSQGGRWGDSMMIEGNLFDMFDFYLLSICLEKYCHTSGGKFGDNYMRTRISAT